MVTATSKAPYTKFDGLKLAGAVALAGVLWIAMDKVHRVGSHSMHQKLTLSVGGAVHVGDLVEFTVAQDSILPTEDLPAVLTKRVVCMAPSVLSWRSDAFWCDAARLGEVMSETSDHRPLTRFVWEGPVPQGKAFVLGDRPHSYDSRYLGFIDVDRLNRVVGLI